MRDGQDRVFLFISPEAWENFKEFLKVVGWILVFAAVVLLLGLLIALYQWAAAQIPVLARARPYLCFSSGVLLIAGLIWLGVRQWNKDPEFRLALVVGVSLILMTIIPAWILALGVGALSRPGAPRPIGTPEGLTPAPWARAIPPAAWPTLTVVPTPTPAPLLRPPPTPTYLASTAQPTGTPWPIIFAGVLPNDSAYTVRIEASHRLLALRGPDAYADVRIRARVRIQRAADLGRGSWGVICRYQSPEAYYAFFVGLDDMVSIWRREPGEFRPLARWRRIPTPVLLAFPDDPEAPERLSPWLVAECQGDTLRLRINGYLIHEVRDPEPLPAGRIGLIVGNEEERLVRVRWIVYEVEDLAVP
ncbi:MAG: hypothetical protein GXO36_03835 [Chloroflexi bacterium]|nr:hypothetical protein [Chloroflexota bacterium]